MERRVFYNADAEMLIVPQQGRLHVATELGRLDVEPQEIVLIPRGMRFRVTNCAATCARTTAPTCACPIWA